MPSRVPGFPRHTQSLGAPRRKAGALPALDPDIIAQEIVEDLPTALAQFAEIASFNSITPAEHPRGAELRDRMIRDRHRSSDGGMVLFGSA